MSRPFILNGDSGRDGRVIAIIEDSIRSKLTQTIYGKNMHICYTVKDGILNTIKEVLYDISNARDIKLNTTKIILIYDTLESTSDTAIVSDVLGYKPEVFIIYP